jgi:hypothetical protein
MRLRLNTLCNEHDTPEHTAHPSPLAVPKWTKCMSASFEQRIVQSTPYLLSDIRIRTPGSRDPDPDPDPDPDLACRDLQEIREDQERERHHFSKAQARPQIFPSLLVSR